MKHINFDSNFAALLRTGGMPPHVESVVKYEPMLFRASPAFAYANGGIYTKAFIDRLPRSFKCRYIDSRVHMLIPGWFPCIPGWHVDDVPRTREDGQPDHDNPIYKANHILAIVGDASVTTFAVGRISLPDVPMYHGPIYGVWHKRIQQAIRRGQLREVTIPEGRLVYFNCQSFHRGNPATKFGWRFFIRATEGSSLEPLNETRQQTQVYLPTPEKGW